MEGDITIDGSDLARRVLEQQAISYVDFAHGGDPTDEVDSDGFDSVDREKRDTYVDQHMHEALKQINSALGVIEDERSRSIVVLEVFNQVDDENITTVDDTVGYIRGKANEINKAAAKKVVDQEKSSLTFEEFMDSDVLLMNIGGSDPDFDVRSFESKFKDVEGVKLTIVKIGEDGTSGVIRVETIDGRKLSEVLGEDDGLYMELSIKYDEGDLRRIIA